MSNHDDLTSTLTRALEEHAHAMDGSGLHLADVRGRARGIRRRRQAIAVAGAAAVVGLAVPTTLLATHSNARPEPAPATQSVDPSPTARAVPLTDLDVHGLPTGAQPQVPWVTLDGVVHLPDGTSVPVALDAPPSAVTQLDDGRLVVTGSGRAGVSSVTVVRGDGGSSTYDASSAPVLSPHAQSAAWVAPNGAVEVLQVGREEPLGIGEVQGSQAHVVGNDASCDLGAARDQAARGCTVWVTADDPASGARATYAVSATGVVRPVNSSYARWLTAASYAGTTTAVTEIGDSGSCSGAFGSADASNPPEWSTCRNTLETVSPDGRHVLAGPAYQDGIGSGEVAIYTADGRRVLDLRSTAGSQAFYHSAVWEDPEHVLLTVFQQGHWSVVRLGVDGRAEYAVAPVGGSMDAPPFATAEAPPWQ